MTARQQAFWERRAALVQRSHGLRDRLATHGRALVPVFNAADKARLATRWLKGRPWVAGVVVGLLVIRRASTAFRWGRRAWAGWRWWQRIRREWLATR